MTSQHTLAILGCGNMGTAIIKGFAPTSQQFQYFMYTPSFTRAKELAEATGGTAIKKLTDLPPCDFYLIACKPQQFEALAKELHPLIAEEAAIISVMAGITVAKMAGLLPRTKKFVRVMPNLPALIGEGVSGIYFTPNVETGEKRLIDQLFSAVSKVFTFDNEEAIDIVVATTGSGPGYIFDIAHHMVRKTVDLGMDEHRAVAMIRQLFRGSALLMAGSNDSPEALKAKVASKGGTTMAGLAVLEKYNIGEVIAHTLDAAYRRAKELAK